MIDFRVVYKHIVSEKCEWRRKSWFYHSIPILGNTCINVPHMVGINIPLCVWAHLTSSEQTNLAREKLTETRSFPAGWIYLWPLIWKEGCCRNMQTGLTGFMNAVVCLCLVNSVILSQAADNMEGNVALSEVRHKWE